MQFGPAVLTVHTHRRCGGEGVDGGALPQPCGVLARLPRPLPQAMRGGSPSEPLARPAATRTFRGGRDPGSRSAPLAAGV